MMTERKLHGGLRYSKTASASIEQLPVPVSLKIYLQQHQGPAGTPIVVPGEKVLKGQPLSSGETLAQVPVHASSSGTVESVNERYISIKTDGLDTSIQQLRPLPVRTQWTRQHLIENLHASGITGLGGAGYPGAKKLAALSGSASILLINAAECDPIIHCDDALMIEHADEIIEGIDLLAEACQADAVIIGIEDNKPAACQAIKKATNKALNTRKSNATLVKVPAIYPSGAEKTLLELCTGHTHKPDATLTDSGIISFNIATCYAIYKAVCQRQPLISRIVTLVDAGGDHRNFELRTGTPVAELLTQAYGREFTATNRFSLTSGGQMMPSAIDINSAIGKTTNCLSVINTTLQPVTRPCIRCGACADVCPQRLMPQHLFTFAQNFNADSLDTYQLNNCIECRCCDQVCPSHLPLTTQFISAKQQIQHLAEAGKLAEIAKQRYQKRQQRLSNKNPLSTRRAAAGKNKPAGSDEILSGTDQQQKRKQLIEAALRRSRDKNRPKKVSAASRPITADKNGNDS